jgi:hypothetical protein
MGNADSQHNTLGGPSWVSHPPSWTSLWVTEFLIKPDIFGQLFCDWGKTINLFFLFLALQSQFPHQKELVISDFVSDKNRVI